MPKVPKYNWNAKISRGFNKFHQVPLILSNTCVVTSIRAHTKSINRLLVFRICGELHKGPQGPQQVPHVLPGPFYYYLLSRPSAVSLLDPAKDKSR